MQLLMKLISRSALALLLGTAATAALTSCDYGYTPGRNQVSTDFSHAPKWRNEDVNRDSINYKQRVTAPSGVGSATAIANGTVDDKLNSAPGNDPGSTASGQPLPASPTPGDAPAERPTESGE
jgi:hypothetical protein